MTQLARNSHGRATDASPTDASITEAPLARVHRKVFRVICDFLGKTLDNAGKACYTLGVKVKEE